MCIIERLFSSSLVAMVELAHPRKLRACHFKVSACVCSGSRGIKMVKFLTYPDFVFASIISIFVLFTKRRPYPRYFNPHCT